ncbi:MAG: hypothetical protein WBV69_04150 [Candidatus Sulfotelmatobacter sp.]
MTALANYQEQANEPFEHEARMKELLARQAQLNAALDFDKDQTQVAPPTEVDFGLAGDVLQGPSIKTKIQRDSALYYEPARP